MFNRMADAVKLEPSPAGASDRSGARLPGAYCLYNNRDFNAAGAVFEQEAGIDTFVALEADLGARRDQSAGGSRVSSRVSTVRR